MKSNNTCHENSPNEERDGDGHNDVTGLEGKMQMSTDATVTVVRCMNLGEIPMATWTRVEVFKEVSKGTFSIGRNQSQ